MGDRLEIAYNRVELYLQAKGVSPGEIEKTILPFLGDMLDSDMSIMIGDMKTEIIGRIHIIKDTLTPCVLWQVWPG